MTARDPQLEAWDSGRSVDQVFERVAAVAGALVVLMTIPAVLLYPNVQPPYEPERVRVAYFDGASAAAASIGLQLLSLIPFVVFVVALWRRLRGSTETLAMVALLGGFGTVILLAVCQAVVAGVLLQANFVDPDADLGPILAVVSSIDQSVTLPLSIMTGAAGLAILIGRALPLWLGWLGILIAFLGLLGVLAIPAAFTLEETRDVLASANPLALLLWLIWVIGVSFAFARSPQGRSGAHAT